MVDGKKIRSLREEKALSIPKFAQAVCASQTMISYIETGIRQPSIELLVRIANFFGLAVDDFLVERNRDIT